MVKHKLNFLCLVHTTKSFKLLGEVLASRRELSTPIEEDEEQDNTQQDAPISQIENNISALLRGDLTVARVRG